MSDWGGEDRRENKESWHLSKSIDLSHLLVTATIVIAGFIYITEMRKDIDINAMQIANNEQRLSESEERIVKRLDTIDTKLDKLIKKVYKAR